MADTMYTVKKGDTLSEIAVKYGTTVAQLAKWNDIDDVNYIVVGQKLVVKSSSSGTAESAKTPADAKKPVIKAFGIQSGTDRTLYATWKWTGGVVKGSDRTDHYRVLWEYTTGDGIWFEGSDSTSTKKQSTYNAPSNAKKVRVRVKAIAKKHKVNKKEVAWFATTDWSTIDGKVKAVTKLTDPIVVGQPPVPTVTIENYILTASVTNIASDINADEIMFEIVQDDVTVITGAYPVDIHLSTASMSLPIEAGHVYKARCVAYNSKEEEQSEWTDYSANVGTIPVGPSGFNTVEAASESSAKLTWTASLNATGYDIEYTSDRNYFDTSNQTQTLSIEGGGSTIGIVTGLETGKEWFFRIKAKNANGESGWSGIASVVLGKDPAAPTTWSSSTTCTAGDAITLYWVHNSEDNSPQTSAEIKVSLLVGDSVISETTIPITTTDTDATKTYSYVYETTGLTENTRILWSVRTAGITGNYSEWSTVREINVYAPPTLILEITDQNGTAIDTVTEYPIKVKATPGPVSQNAVSMYLEVVANESYTTVDNIGNEQLVKKGDKVYSTVVDRPSTEYGCIFWLYPSSVNLDNNISYTVKCLVSMDTGLTAESNKEFTVSWTETQYVPNAEIGINKDDISAYIKPYVEASAEDKDGSDNNGVLVNEYKWISFSKDPHDTNISLPTGFAAGCALIYNDELHILGGWDGSNTTGKHEKMHFKWNGTEWSEVSTLPYGLKYGAAVVYNDEIHILGGFGSENRENHYRFDGTNWIKVSTLPYLFEYGTAVVYNDEIHILGGFNGDDSDDPIYGNGDHSRKHYKWNGTEWTEVSTLPIPVYDTVVYNNEIHIFTNKHYKWNGNSWSFVSDTPDSAHNHRSVVYDNRIHILGTKAHYEWDGTNWSEVSTLPYKFYDSSVVVYNDEIHILGGYDLGFAPLYHYRYAKISYITDATPWTSGIIDDYPVFNICRFKDKYIACCQVGLGNEGIYVSDDLITWELVFEYSGNYASGMGLCCNDDIIVCSGHYFYYSTDGITWQTANEDEYHHTINKIIYEDGYFVAVGQFETIYRSLDGINWRLCDIDCEHTSDNKGEYDNVFYHDGKFIAIGAGIPLYTRSIGDGWYHCSIYDYDTNKDKWPITKTIQYHEGRFIGYKIKNIQNLYELIIYESNDCLKWTELSNTEVIGESDVIHYTPICCLDREDIRYAIVISMEKPIYMCSEDLINWSYPEYFLGKNSDLGFYPKGLNYFDELGRLVTYGQHKSYTDAYDIYILDFPKPALTPPVTLSVYRREFDGDFVEIAKGIKNGANTYVVDPHPALDFARYRIVAIDNKTGAVSYNDPPGYPVGEKAIIIQWDEKWSNFDVDPGNEDALSNPPWTGSLLKLPYNIDVSDSNDTDVSLVEYIGRKHPVSYYGTQRGETASWSVDIPKHDKDTLYALRRLRVYMGDVYVREPSGSGYWARIKVSFSQTHCETVIPVSIELTRVEGGK